MAEIIAKMDARDEARDEQMRILDRQISELIDKLTTMSAAGGEDTYNKDLNKKRDRPGPGRGRGGHGGGGRDGGGRDGGGRGGGNRYRGKAVKQELTVAQKKAALQAQIDALG